MDFDVLYYRHSKERKETKTMYETVKIVNDYEIIRMIGTHGYYHVPVLKSASGETIKFCYFKTIKAAAAFCETL